VSGEVFLDSGVFIAFLVGSDARHEAVVKLLDEPPRRWSTSVLVVSETYSWFLHRFGEEEARSFRHLLEELPNLVILGSDEGHREAVWKKLDHLRGVKLTYVDASSLVWIEAKGIRTVWGTDRHLGVEGADVVPGPP
jgi:predicted nucleic acid-binding protein